MPSSFFFSFFRFRRKEMSVIELGTWFLRAGYTSDFEPTYVNRSLTCGSLADKPGVSSFMQLLRLASSRSNALSSSSEAGSAAETEELSDDLIPMWTLPAFQQMSERHGEAIQNMHIQLHRRHDTRGRGLLAQEQAMSSETFEGLETAKPLMLVAPETWHQNIHVIERLCSMLLESPNTIPALYCIRPSVGWVLSEGKASAVVTDIGYSHVTTAAVVDGQVLRQTIQSAPVGSSLVLDAFERIAGPILDPGFAVRFPYFSARGRSHLKRDISNELKHLHGFVANTSFQNSEGSTSLLGASALRDEESRAGAMASSTPELVDAACETPPRRREWNAPDGSLIELDEAQCSRPYEIFFEDSRSLQSGTKGVDLAEMVLSVKRQLDPEWLLTTVQHIVAGGISATPGLTARLIASLKDRDAVYSRYAHDGGIIPVSHPRHGAWIGASIAASSSSIFPLWVSRKEWEEEGVSVLHRKFFY